MAFASCAEAICPASNVQFFGMNEETQHQHGKYVVPDYGTM
jgi:hypothetical protein